MDSPSIFVDRRREALAQERAEARYAAASARLDELEADIEGHRRMVEQSELDALTDEYHVASVEAGLVDLDQLVSNLRMSCMRVPLELIAMKKAAKS
jgi:multidrug resistance efflux pump